MAAAFAWLLLSLGCFLALPRAVAQFTYTEDFKNNTAAGWVLNPAGNSTPAPVLTSGSAPRTGDPEFGNSTIDPSGAGWLRLTNNTTNTSNAVYFDTPIPSAGNSVNVTFGVNMYGGNNYNGTGADGITFFLYDASKTFEVGADGGSIGYAQKDAGTIGVLNPGDHNGMNGGWVGVSLDAYGNFSVAGEGRIGGTNSLQPNSIVVRGPGSGLTGYNYLAGTGNVDYTDSGGATTQEGGDGAVPELPYTMAFATSSARPNQSTQYRNVSITFDENSQLAVSIQFGEDGLWYDMLNVDLSSFVRPEQLKMGFSAGTGAGTQVYEVGGLLSVTATAGSGNFVWDNGEGASFKIWGTAENDPLNWAGNTNPTLKSNVLFNSAYVDTAQSIDVTGSDKVIKNMYFSGADAYTLSTSDQRKLIFDSDSTGTPTSINITSETGNNASHTIAMDVLMNKNLEVNNNVSSANTFTISGGIDTNGNILTTKGVGTTRLSGVISGTGSLVKNDTGTTILSGTSANTYTGTTTVNGGTLQIEKAGALGSTAAGTTVATGGTLALGGTGTTFAAEGLTISGDGVGGNGALRNVAGNNTWTGTTALGGTGSNTIGVDSGTTLTVSGVVSGASGNNLTKAGTGTLVLSGTNTYNGSTTINGGTVRISTDANLGTAPGAATAGQLTLNGGTLNTTATMTLNANRGIELATPGGGTFDTNSGTTLTYNGIAAGAGPLTKTGTGTLTLGGANTYTGATNINAGTLTLGANNVLANTTAVSVASGATFNLNNFSDTVGSLAGSSGSAVTLGSGTLTAGGDNTSTTFAGVASGTGGLTKTGTGTLTLSGANTFTGSLNVSGGTVGLGASNVLANTATLALNGGIFATNGFSDTLGSLSLLSTSTIDFTNQAGVLTFGGTNSYTAGQLNIANWAGNPTGSGSSQLLVNSLTALSGTFLNNITFTGYATGAQIIQVGAFYELVPVTGSSYTWGTNANGNWTSTSWVGGVSNPGGVGTTSIFGSAILADRTITLDAARTTGYLVFNDNNNYTIASATNRLTMDVSGGSATISVSNTGANTISAGLTLNDALTINQNSTGTLTLSNANAITGTNQNITVNGSGNTTISGTITTGTGTLTKNNAGELTLSGANTFTGAITVNGGVLSISNENNLGATSATADLTLNGGTLRVSGADVTVATSLRNLVLGTIGGTIDTVNNLTWDNGISGTGSLTKTGTGSLTLLDPTTFTGAFNINAGSVIFDGGNNRLADGVAVTIASGATLNVNTRSDTIGSLAGAGTLTNAGATDATLTFGGANTNTTFSGTITDATGALNLVKAGTAQTIISGNNSYDGTTTVNAGTLTIQSATGLGTTTAGTTVASGAALELQHASGLTIGTETLSLAGTGVDNNGALRNVSGNNSLAGTITLTGATEIQSDAGTLTLSNSITATDQALTLDGAGNITANGVIGLGTGTLTKNGTGYVTLAGANTYTGATTVAAGTLEIQNNSGLGTTAAGTTVANGATLALSGTSLSTAEALTLSGQGVGSAGALRNLSGNNTLSGTITLNAESYVGVDGSSALTSTGAISGGFGLTKTGTGTLILDSATANSYTGTTAITTGTLEVRRSDSLGFANATTIASGASLKVNGSGLTIAENFTTTGSGVSNAGAIQNTGGNNTLTGNISFTGNTTISSTTGTTLTANGVVAGAFNLVKDGAGDLTLGNSANTYTGTTTVRNGSLTVTTNAPVSTNGSLGNSASVVQLGDAGTTGNVALLAGGTGGVTVARQIAVNNNGTGTTIGGSNTSGTNTFSGTINLAKDVNLTAAGGGTVNFTGVIDGSGAVTKTGTGTAVLSAASTYTGATTVSAGTLQINNAAALGTTAAGTTVNSGATLALNGGITTAASESLSLAGNGASAGALNSLSGDNTVAGTIALTGATTIAAQADTLTLSGVISGANNLTTAGAGNITLTANNTFSGTTTIGGTGIVSLNGSGTGALAATTALTLASGSTLSLGASNQINNSANLTLSGGTLLLNGNQDVLNNLTLTASTTSTFNYLNDNSLLRFGGTASVGSGSQLTIENWAGNPTTGGSTNYGLLFNSQSEATTLAANVLFNGWSTLGGNQVIANGAYWEIVPTVTIREWLGTGGGNWDSTNWTGGVEPDSTSAIALLGNNITANTTASISTSASGTDTDTVAKLIIDTTGNRNYTITGSTGERLEFNAASGTAQLIVSGDGTHTISAPVFAQTDLVISNDGTDPTPLTISGAMDLVNGASSDLTVGGSGRTLISGVISNTTAGASLVKTGSGTLALSNTNTYTGDTTIRNGTIQVNGNAPSGANGRLGNSSNAVIINDSGTNAGDNTALLITDTNGGSSVGRAITVGSQGATTTLGGTNTSGTNTFSGAISLGKDVALSANTGGTVNFSGVLSGAGGLDKVGAGTVLISGTSANTNSGNVTVTAGTLSIDKDVAGGNAAIDDNAAVTIATGATLRFNGTANQTNETIGSLAGDGTLNNQQATALALTTGGNNTSTIFSGAITDSGGNLSLIKNGTGTLTLSGATANTFDGDVTINNGTLIAAKDTALGNTTGNTSVAAGASLALQGNITIATGEDLTLTASTAPNIASLANLSGINTYAGAVSLSGTAAQDVKLDAATGSQLTLSGVVSNTNAIDVFKSGGGTLVLTGANTYSGQTSVAAGTLVVGNNTALGSATAGTADDTFVQIGATLAFDHATGVTVGSDEGLTLYATASPTGPSLKNIGGNNTVQGNIALSGGINTGVIINSNAGNLDLAGVISNGANANSITKTGTGTLTLSGASANTFGGAVNANDGTIVLNKTAGQNAIGPGNLNIGDSIGSTASAIVQLSASNQINNATTVTIATDGKLDLQANSDAIGALTMSGGSVTATGAGTLTLGGNLTFNGIGSNTASITSNVDLGGNRQIQVGNNGVNGDTDLAINGVISGTGNSLTKTDLGTLTLSGAANTFTGNFQVTDGTVVLDKTAVAGVKGNATGVNNTTVTIGDNVRGANTAILEVSGDGLASGETSDQIANTATLIVNSDGKFLLSRDSGSDPFTETVGAIAGSGNIDLGTYGLIAGGNNASTTFSGTLVGDSTSLFTKTGTGTLTIDSNLGFNGGVNLSGGTLAFNASNAFTGTVNVAAGTTLRLSNSTLNINNLNFTGSGSITLDFAGSASTLNVANLNIAAGVTINIINWQDATDYFFATNWTGATQDSTGSSPMNQVVFNNPTWTGNDTKWQSYDDQITPVPEPSTYGALLIGALGAALGWRRWRKSRSQA